MPAETRHFERVSLDETNYTEIRFRNESHNLDLAGMLFMPDAELPVPAAVVIHGSGTSARNNGWYLTLVKYLQDRGVAVLLPDKRGSEKSAGDWRSASFQDLAMDTVAAVEAARSTADIDPARIGVIGMSQGGWIAPIVATEADDLNFVVSMVGSAVTPVEQLQFEEVHNLRQFGFLPGIAHGIAAMSTQYIRHIKQKTFWSQIGDFDPMPYWQRVDVDTLVLFGSEDTNTPTQASVALLEGISNQHIEIETYQGSGHALESPEGLGSSIIREDALSRISDFIQR